MAPEGPTRVDGQWGPLRGLGQPPPAPQERSGFLRVRTDAGGLGGPGNSSPFRPGPMWTLGGTGAEGQPWPGLMREPQPSGPHGGQEGPSGCVHPQMVPLRDGGARGAAHANGPSEEGAPLQVQHVQVGASGLAQHSRVAARGRGDTRGPCPHPREGTVSGSGMSGRGCGHSVRMAAWTPRDGARPQGCEGFRERGAPQYVRQEAGAGGPGSSAPWARSRPSKPVPLMQRTQPEGPAGPVSGH